MKKLFFIIFISFTCKTSYGQIAKEEVKEDSKMQMGISAGPGVTHTVNFSGKDGEVKFIPRRIRYSAALHFQYKFSRACALRTELFFERKRVHYRDWWGYYSHTNNAKFLDEDRIELPLFFRVYMHRFFTEAGIYLGYKYGSRQTFLYYSYNGDKKNLTNKEKSEYYKYEFDTDYSLYKGICLGMGYDVINREKISFSISVRDDLELSELGRNYLNYNTINLLFGVAYKF